MAKKTVLTLTVFLASLSLVLFAGSVRGKNNNIDETFTIQGIGYPPIKASSVAQAHLMAKRAAVVDAYRNALARAGISNYSDTALFTGLAGFVRGLTVIEEEYLEDGGIRILARVSTKDVNISSGAVSKKPKETWLGPLKVSLDEWFKIIEKLVKIEK